MTPELVVALALQWSHGPVVPVPAGQRLVVLDLPTTAYPLVVDVGPGLGDVAEFLPASCLRFEGAPHGPGWVRTVLRNYVASFVQFKRLAG